MCYDLEGWDREGGKETQEEGYMGIYVCIWLIHFVVQQKLLYSNKAIIVKQLYSNKDLFKKKVIRISQPS